MTLTRADIMGRKTVSAVHMDMAGGASSWMYGLEGLPRLHVYDYHSPRHGKYRHWYVDQRKVRDLDAALAVLNGVMTLDDAAREEKPVKKISLSLQIDEVTRELNQRREVYPRMVASRKLRQSLAEYQMERMEAVKATLEWLRDNETDVRAFVAARAEAKKKQEGEAA